MKYKLLFFILLLLPSFVFAQKHEGVLYGKIIDENGKAIEFVNVAVQNTPYGVVSDSRGTYSLILPSDTLINIVYSFIGYEEVRLELKLKDGEKRKNDVVMNISSTILPETVVHDQAIKTSTITRLDAREAILLPSVGAGGVEDMVKTLAGVSSTNELSSQYNVRGGKRYTSRFWWAPDNRRDSASSTRVSSPISTSQPAGSQQNTATSSRRCSTSLTKSL